MGTPYVFFDRFFGGVESSALLLFTGAHMPTSYDAAAAIQAKIEDPYIEKIVVIAPAYLRSETISLLSDDAFRDRIPTRLLRDDCLLGLLISSGGSCSMMNQNGSEISSPDRLGDALREAGLRHIFQSYNALLDGEGRFHFRKPSKAHSSQFLRISAALSEPAEVDFIAIWLLKYLSLSHEAILCDTASISSVPYAALTLARRFDLAVSVSFEIGTFHSFRFINDTSTIVRNNALYIISVTTAAHLEKKMIEKGVRLDQIVTLYGVCSECAAPVLCNLHTGRNPIPRITNYYEDNCPECLAGTPLVNIVDDDFLAIVTDVARVIPTAADAPRWLNHFMKEAVGRSVVRCYYGQGPLENIHDVYLDVRRLLISEQWKDIFQRHLSQAIPSSLQVIYYVDENGAREMAEEAKARFHAWTQKEVAVIRMSAEAMRACPTEGAVLVIGSVTAGGRQIAAASQLLRDVRPKGEVVFLLGLLRLPTAEEARRLRSNLTFTPDRRFRFALHIIEEIEFPDNTRSRPSLWANEARIWQRLMLSDVEIQPTIAEIIEARIKQIEDSATLDIQGLSDGAFLDTVHRNRLVLRPNFSLFDFPYDNVSQSEVFFAMSSLLHNLRVGGMRPKLTQSPFRRTVLDPQTFVRFNDGIVQAALLRAALPIELDYSFDIDVSAEIAPILDSVLVHCEQPAGEAINEFLYALYAGNLKIAKAHLAPVLQRHIDRRSNDTFDAFIAKQILDKIT